MILVENKMTDAIIDWKPDDMIEVSLKEKDDFLKIKETLTRIGIASRKDNILYQTCHILHKTKNGESVYYIVSFKELFNLDKRQNTLTLNDIRRRNRIIKLLHDWGLVDVVHLEKIEDVTPIGQIKIIPFAEKSQWNLQAKYNLGKKNQK